MSDLLEPGPLDGLSYYRATANRHDSYPALAGDTRADVCIIGGGFTGLSAALELARADRKVVVVENGTIAWGASGRNGGQICTGFSPGMEKFEAVLGREQAQACFDVAEEAKALIVERIERYAIACDLKWGYLVVANKPSHVDYLKEHGEELARYGYDDWVLLSKQELEERLGSRVYHGGFREGGAGHFHPLNYALGLAAAAVSEGAVIHENTRVLSLTDGKTVRVRTSNGEIVADQVIVACNGYLDGLVPGLDGRVMPVASYVMTTEPLDKARARSLIRDDEAVGDTNFVTDYFRLTADRRLLFGGRCSYSGIHPKDLGASMKQRMLKVFPQLEDTRADFAWGGYIGITYNRLPDVGRRGNNVYFAQGYSGQGVALAGMFGKLMAEAVRGDSERFDVFSRVRHAPFPGGILRRPALTLGMLYYRLKDIVS